jgi:hypothetical protein
MKGKVICNIFHPVRVLLLLHEGFAQRAEVVEVAAKKCELHLQMAPGDIIRRSFPGKPFHRRGIFLEKCDSVTQSSLKGVKDLFCLHWSSIFLASSIRPRIRSAWLALELD